MQCSLCDATVDVAGDNQYYCPRCQAIRGPELVYLSRAEKAALAAAQAEAVQQPEAEVPEGPPEMADIFDPLPPPIAKQSAKPNPKPIAPPPLLPADMSMLAKAALHKPQPISEPEPEKKLHSLIVLIVAFVVSFFLLIISLGNPGSASIGVYWALMVILQFLFKKKKQLCIILIFCAILLLFLAISAFSMIL